MAGTATPKFHNDMGLAVIEIGAREFQCIGAKPPFDLVMGVTLILMSGSFALFPMMGREFLPAFNEGTATINLLSAPGTSLEQSNRVGAIAERLLRTVPEVVHTGRRTGRAEMDEHAEGVHSSEIDVDFRESNYDDKNRYDRI